MVSGFCKQTLAVKIEKTPENQLFVQLDPRSMLITKFGLPPTHHPQELLDNLQGTWAADFRYALPYEVSDEESAKKNKKTCATSKSKLSQF